MNSLKKKHIFIGFFLLLTGCTIVDTVDENGVLWEYYTPSPITIGVETMPAQNLVLFADESGTLYALDAGSGLLRWKITPPLTITTILPTDTGLYLIGYSNTGPQGSVLYTIDTLNGAIASQKSFPIKPVPNRYLVTPEGRLLYSSSQAVLISNTGALSGTYSLLNGIIAIERVGTEYYALIRESDNTTKVQKYNQNFNAIQSSTYGANPTGSIIAWNTGLYIGTTTVLLRSDTTPALSLFKSFPVKAGMATTSLMLFVPSAENFNGSIRAYDTFGNQQWFVSTYAPLSYAPLVYNSSYQVVFSLDDNGNIGVYDASTGHLLFQRYLGALQKTGLKLPMDLYQNYIFLPFSSPAKLVCFSLRYASRGQ
ncbi:MAG: PQQ-binding-like beta-propeller repeat protein [Brevinematales bacterium]|nr:PQQ-binding-like beta-propeller repeat protein [Brevinematales bacterium]